MHLLRVLYVRDQTTQVKGQIQVSTFILYKCMYTYLEIYTVGVYESTFFLVVLFYILRFPVSVSRFVIPFDHTERHTTVSRTPLDEGSARRRGL